MTFGWLRVDPRRGGLAIDRDFKTIAYTVGRLWEKVGGGIEVGFGLEAAARWFPCGSRPCLTYPPTPRA